VWKTIVAVIKERGQKGKVVVDIVQGEMTATCMKTSFMSQKFFFPAILDKKFINKANYM
jgi:hypothetical protein